MILPDVLAADLKVVFCGTAAGTKSAQVGAYYAGPGNKFWPTLHAIGLTPHRLEPRDFREIIRYGLGLTDLAKFKSGADRVLRREDFCAQTVRRLIDEYRPLVLAFTSKRAAREYFGREVPYGLHAERIGRTALFTLTSPSGLACGAWQQGRHWHDLGRLVGTASASTVPGSVRR